MSAYICIMGAVAEEIAGIKNRMQVENRRVLGRTTVFEGQWQGYGIVLVRSGIGRQQARNALSEVLEQYQVVLVLSIGYAGGVNSMLKLGDLVLADKVYEGLAEAGSTPAVRNLDPALVAQAMLLSCPEGVSSYCGGLMTVDRVLSRPEEKKALGEKHPVFAVEMETSALVALAQEKEVPILSIRTISDTVDQELLDLSHVVGADGEVNKLKAGWHVLTHPGDIKKALDLRAHTKKATEHLTLFVAEYLSKLK